VAAWPPNIQREERLDRAALEGPPLRRARHRLPWLLVGLVGSMIAAAVMSRFEHVLESQVAIAFFVPSIIYLADAIGTQNEAIAVRGLSLSRLPLRRLLAGEVRTGLLIGVTLAVLSFAIVAVRFNDLCLATSVASAILVAGAVATTTGLLLPWALSRIGSDPAFGSGPVATVIQDVLSILIYFFIVGRVMT
jgi:magnesium transporter